MAFNVQEAREAGYSDPEIATYLAKDQGFDLAGAERAGYSPTEIIGELAPAVGLTWTQRVTEKLGKFGDRGMPGMLSPDAAMAARPIVARLPGNIAKSIGANVTSQLTAARGSWSEFEAATARRQGEQAEARGDLDTAARKYNIGIEQDEEAQRLAAIGREARIGGAEAIPKDAGTVERGIQQGVASVATTLPMLIAGGPVGGTLAMGVGAGAERYRDLRDQGVEQDAAIRSGALLGSLEALTEFIPGKSFFKIAKGDPRLKQLLVEFFASDLVGENLTTVANIVDDYLNQVRPDVSLADFIEGLKETTVSSLAAVGSQGSVAGIMRAARDRANRQAAAREAGVDPARPQVPPASDQPPVTPAEQATGGIPTAPEVPQPPVETPPQSTGSPAAGSPVAVPPAEATAVMSAGSQGSPVTQPAVATPAVDTQTPTAATTAISEPPATPDATALASDQIVSTPTEEGRPVRFGQAERLFAKPPIQVTDVDPTPFATPQEARQYALDNFSGHTFPNADTGWNITVARNGIDKAMSQSRREGSVHWRAVRGLGQLLERAVLVESHADRQGKQFKAIHRFIAPLRMGDKLFKVKLTVREREDGHRFYDQSLTEIRRADAHDGSPPAGGEATRVATVADKSTAPGPSAQTVSISDLLAGQVRDFDGQPFEAGGPSTHGPFGPIFTEYRGNAQGAITRLMQERTGEAVGALHHPAIGDIDLVWGKEGTNKHNGHGLSKLVRWHPEVIDDLQGVVSSMHVVGSSDNRVQLESADHKGAVRLDWDGVAKRWLLTAFEKDESGADTRTDTADDNVAGDSPPAAFGSIVDQPPADRVTPSTDDETVSKMAAGAAGTAYVPLHRTAGGSNTAAPSIPLGTAATGTERSVEVPTEPVRREHIMDLFQRLLGLKIYQGKPFKVRKALGYFRPSNFEIRIKGKNDLEVAAHEVFHWLDRSYPTIRALYHKARFGPQLMAISYDASKLHEGFAEFGRLFMTNEVEAVSRAPDFYDAFVAELKAVGVYAKLARVQEQMHQWYQQGADARARSKIGEVPPPISAQISAFLNGWVDRAVAAALDHLQAAKVIERNLTGTIADDASRSPYKTMRLLAGARSVANTFLNHGTLNWNQDGSLEFTGKGLRQIFEPVGDAIDDAMAYFVGRRAQELAKHGKENLFSKDEIEALLLRGLKNPKSTAIQKAFDDYQAYTERLLDFAETSGIISAETRAIWRGLYENYVPFYRVSETLGGANVSGNNPALHQPGAVFKRLTGGTGNLRDIWENLSLNTATIVHAALKNQAKRQLFATIQRSPKGQQYAVKIGTDTHAVPVAMRQVETVLRSMVDEARTRAMDPKATAADKAHYAQVAMALDVLTGATSTSGGAALDDLQSQATFFTQGHPPSIPDKDSVLVDGKRVWFQIGDPLLWDMLTEINVFRPLGLAEKALGLAKRVLTRGVTLTPEFQIANLLRDSYNAFTMSKGGQLPVVDALRAFRDIWTESDNYKLFLANGGGFGNAISDESKSVKRSLSRLDRHHILDTPAKLVDFWDKWGQSFELATRLAEFKRMKARGASSREAAFQGREISSDFAMRGKATLTRLAITSLPFFGARLQGLYRLERELFERDGRQSRTGERALSFATRALVGITLPSLLLYAFNKDDPDYEELPEDTKNLYWAVKIWWSGALPDSDRPRQLGPIQRTKDAAFILIPKPFEVGALFATLPERIWESKIKGTPKPLADAALFTLVNTFQVNPDPQLVKPPIDVFYRNRYWTGAPIVPVSLQNVEASEQYRPWTAKSMVAIGQRFNVSPLKLEALINGYLGTLGQYTLMAADALVSSDHTGEDPDKKMSQYPVFRRFLREQPYTRTAFEARFYELADEVTKTTATMAKMRREARADKIEQHMGEAEKRQFFTLGETTGKFTDLARDIDAEMRKVRADPFMSGDKKRAVMDALQADQNELFKQAVEALDTPTLERYRDALEGKP